MFKRFRGRKGGTKAPPAPADNQLPYRTSDPTVTEQASEERALSPNSGVYPRNRSASTDPERRRSAASKFEISQAGLALPSQRSRQSSRDRRNDPRGLTVLFTPLEFRSADVIFVHGLGGSSHKSWCKNQDPDLFWPKLWLPAELELDSARILTYGYDAHFASTGPTSVSNINDFAKALLYDMRFANDDDAKNLSIGEVPIIFVVHSMGGLVFKRAYLLGRDNPDYCDLIKRVQAVLFLSTPHRGTNLALILNRILSVSFAGHSQKQYISDLNKSSSTLEDLNENFRNVASQLQIFSFYETLETNVSFKSLMVLEKDSSILGYPGEISRPLDADHHGVCKFSTAEDTNYKSILAALQSLVRQYCNPRRRTLQSSSETEAQLVADLLAIPGRIDEEYLELQSQWRPGTCGAVLATSTLRDWLTTIDQPGIVWAHARPGSGKSVQSSFLIRHLKESGCHCAYFFFRYMDSTRRSLKMLLLFIASQLADELPAYRQNLINFYKNGLRLDKVDAKVIWQKLFVSALSIDGYSRPIYWVIDALDESDSPSAVVDILSSISALRAPVKVFVTSRDLPAIKNAFSRITSFPTDDLSLDDNMEDIRLCAELEIQNMLGSQAIKKDIVDQVVERAEGNFLWVSLATKQLGHCHSSEEVQDVLGSLPSGMDALYQRMEATISRLNRTADRNLSRVILNWAMFARRPLTRSELLCVLQPEFPEPLDFGHTISETCGHFVVLNTNGKVTLIHQTAREYLARAQNLPFSFESGVGHEILFSKAISLFLDTSIRSKLRRNTLPEFYQYAATSWPYHLSSVSSASDPTMDILVRFFKGTQALSWIQALAMLGQLKVMVYASRHITTFLGKRKKLDASRMPLLDRLSDVSLLESWATDLLRVSGKFGIHLLQDPTVIHRIIPVFCPSNSMVFKYGKRSNLQVSVTGITDSDWDDRLARVSVGSSHKASMVLCYGKYLAVSTLAGSVFIWNTLTYQLLATLEHQQHLFKISFSNSGELLAAYGITTTTIWNTSSWQRLYTLSNITTFRPLCIAFSENDSMIMIATDTRKLLRSRLEAHRVASAWEPFQPNVMEENVSISGAFLNSPTAIAFNPDMTELAVAYRGFPLTIWSLDDEQPISRCKRRVGPSSGPQKTWTGVNRICWHPTSGDLLGIYTDGVVFKWHHVEQIHEELKATGTDATPSEIVCSPEGTVFATSDVNGTIRLYNFQYFSIVYQLSSEDIVTALCFAPDGRKFYDLRGSFCDAWEPNALTRLSDTEERALDMETEASSTILSLSNSEAFADAQVAITALAVGSYDALVYIGNEEGAVEVIDMDGKKLQVIRASGEQMCIDHLACSQDGTYLAYTSLDGKLVVLTNEKPAVGMKLPETYRAIMEAELESTLGPLNGLLFSLDSSHLLVAGQSSAQIWKTAEHPVQRRVLADSSVGPAKWLNHPCRPGEVLAISPTTIYAYNWSTQKTVHQWSLILPKDDAVTASDQSESRPSLSRNSTSQSAFTTLGQASLAIEDIITSQNRKSLIITISTPDLEKKRHPKTYILNTELLRSDGEEPRQIIELRSLPSAINRSLLKPLAMLDPDRLVFLDTSFWVCTWRVGIPEGPIEAKVVRHYFLPTDWVTSGSLSLCRMLTDGSLVVARGKEVAVLKSAVATDW